MDNSTNTWKASETGPRLVPYDNLSDYTHSLSVCLVTTSFFNTYFDRYMC